MRNDIFVKLAVVAAILTVMASCGKKTPPSAKPATPPARQVTMDVPSGTKAPAAEPADTLPGQTHLSVTCDCLAAVNPDDLDMLPRSLASARRDTTLLRRINSGEVFVVRAGEKGYILAKDGNRIQLRFPDKIAWVMVSDTK